MSYPEPVYSGDGGEVSARFRPAGHEPEVVNPRGTRTHYLMKGADSRGEFGLYRWDFGDNRSGPDPHFHRTISESFFILSGTVNLYDGERWTAARAGDFLFVPEGGIHAFNNEPGEPASMLLLFTPGAPREPYFETLARVAGGLSMTDEEKDAFYLAHDNHWI
jgi:mannose-6-phosphate isomerase-like protein (cupin superfamily)